jgi:predicted deacylase
MQVVIGRDLPGDLPQRSEAMAVAFGVTTISRSLQMGVLPGPRSASGYAAAQLGVPSIIAEVGGLGFDERFERRWREQNIRGVLGVMGHLGMVNEPGSDSGADARAAAEEFRFFSSDWIVRPTTSGLLVPLIGPERLGTKVAKDDLLARVISATTFEELEELRAPRDGVLFCVPRSYPVQPHNYAFGAADLTS